MKHVQREEGGVCLSRARLEGAVIHKDAGNYAKHAYVITHEMDDVMHGGHILGKGVMHWSRTRLPSCL